MNELTAPPPRIGYCLFAYVFGSLDLQKHGRLVARGPAVMAAGERTSHDAPRDCQNDA